MLVSVSPGLIIWTIITFLVFAFLLAKLAWKPIITALEGRERGIRDAIAAAETARTEAQKLLKQHEELIAKSESEAREIVQAAREISEQVRREADVAARADAQRLLEQARRDIQNAKEAALRNIRDTVADLAVQAAGKIVQETLDAERHRKMIDDLVERMPETKVN